MGVYVSVGKIDFSLIAKFPNASIHFSDLKIKEVSESKTKDNLIKEQGNHRIELVALDKIVKENSTTINIENKKAVNGKMKLILPILFILLFVAIKFFISFYKKQAQLSNK